MMRPGHEGRLPAAGLLAVPLVVFLLCADWACSPSEKKADPLYRMLKAMESPGSADVVKTLGENGFFEKRKAVLDFHEKLSVLWNAPDSKPGGEAAEPVENPLYGTLLDWEAARASLRAVRPRAALELMDRIESAHSSSGLYWLERSEALVFDLRMDATSLESLSRATELQDAPVYAYFLEEAVYSAMNKYAQSLEAAEAALELRPDIPYFYYRKGRACAVLREHPCALEAYGKIEKIHPKTLYQMADSYFVLGNYDKAIEYYERLLKHYPEHRLVLKRLSEAYLAAGRFPDAERISREDIRREPRDFPGYILLARALYLQGEYRDALDVLEKALDMNPNLPGAHALKGECLMKLGETDRAQEELKWTR